MPEMEKNKNKKLKNSLKESGKELKNSKINLSDLSVKEKEINSASLKHKQRKPGLSMESQKGAGSKPHSAKANKILNMEKEILKLKEALQQSLKDNLYLRADFDNFKKRSLEEQNKLIRFGAEQFIISLANEVLDDLDRAFASTQDNLDIKDIKAGLSLIQKKLSQVLSHFGVHVIDPKGKAFDPAYQEALSYIKAANIPEGHVAETFKKAYKLHDKVIRPAQVVLAKKEKKT